MAQPTEIRVSPGTSVSSILFVPRSETGQFIDQSSLLDASGVLRNLITASSAGVGTVNGLSGILVLSGVGGTSVFTGEAGIIYISGGAGGGSSSTGTIVYVTDTGDFATRWNLEQTGNYLWTHLGNLSGLSASLYALKTDTGSFVSQNQTGGLASSFNLQQTGATLWARDEEISGALANLISASNAGVGSIEGLSGVVEVEGAGNVSVSTQGQTITISGNTGELISVHQTGDFATRFNLQLTGQSLAEKIDTLSGTIGSSSSVSVTGLTVSNPDFTGINLSVIASGSTVFVSGIAQTGVVGDFAFHSELAATGQTNANLIYDLSGFATNSFALKIDTGDFVSNTQTGGIATEFNLFQTGRFLRDRDEIISGFLQSLIQAASAGVSSLEGLSGIINLAPAGSITITTGEGTITISGSTASSLNITGLTVNDGNFIGAGDVSIIASGNTIFVSGVPQTGVEGDFVFRSQTGHFAQTGDLFLTGQSLWNQLSNYALKTETGDFVSNTQTGVFATAQHLSETGINLLQQIALRALSNDTGNFVSQTQTGHFASTGSLFTSGVTLWDKIINTGQTNSNSIYTLSGFLTSSFALKADTGNFVSRTQTGHFAATGTLFSTGQTLWNRIGFLSGTLNQTGQLLRQWVNSLSGDVTTLRTNLFLTGQKIDVLSGFGVSNYALKADTGNFVSAANTGFLAQLASRVSVTGSDFVLQPDLTGRGNVTVSVLGSVITISGTSASTTGTIIYNTDTGDFATRFNLIQTGATVEQLVGDLSGFATNSLALKADTGDFVSHTQTGVFYPAYNPSGFISGLIAGENVTVENNGNGIFTISAAGATGSVNTGSLTGAFYPLNENPSGYLTSVSGSVNVQGGAVVRDGQILIGASGTNSVDLGDLYGSTGIQVTSGSGTLGISITNLVLTGIIAGSNVTVQNNNNGTFTIASTASGGGGGGILGINLQTGPEYTLTLADLGNVIRCSGNEPFNLIIPANATVPFSTGSEMAIEMAGTGVVTISGAAGVTLQSLGNARTLQGQFAMASIYQTNIDVWTLAGALM